MSCCQECEEHEEPNTLFSTIGVGRQRSQPARPVVVGKLIRTSPVPIGTYWIDVIDTQNEADFAAWLLTNQDKVKVLHTEHFDAVNWPDCPITEGECWPSRDWYKFQVLQPVSWNAVQFGFPDQIEPGEVINSSQDTATEPDFSDNCDIACQVKKSAIYAGLIAGSLLVAAFAIGRIK